MSGNTEHPFREGGDRQQFDEVMSEVWELLKAGEGGTAVLSVTNAKDGSAAGWGLMVTTEQAMFRKHAAVAAYHKAEAEEVTGIEDDVADYIPVKESVLEYERQYDRMVRLAHDGEVTISFALGNQNKVMTMLTNVPAIIELMRGLMPPGEDDTIELIEKPEEVDENELRSN